MFLRKFCFIAFFFLLSIYTFAQNNIENDIGWAIAYLSKPVPSDFKKLGNEWDTMSLLEDNLSGDLYIKDGDPIWFLYVQDDIVICTQIWYLHTNIINTITLLNDYIRFFVYYEWKFSEQKQTENTFAYVNKNEILILCKGPLVIDKYTCLSITFTNEKIRRKYGQILK